MINVTTIETEDHDGGHVLRIRRTHPTDRPEEAIYTVDINQRTVFESAQLRTIYQHFEMLSRALGNVGAEELL